jgi:hypothetical protein
MTVICGYTDGKTWAVAADSGLFEEGGDDAPSTGIYFRGIDSKVWRIEKSLMGMSGTSRVDEIARNASTGDPYKLRDLLKSAEVTGEWTLLVVTQKGLYYLSDDFAVTKLRNKYFAIGIACQPALGSLSTSHLLGIPVDKAVKLAVRASIENSIYAVDPIVSKVLEDKKPS